MGTNGSHNQADNSSTHLEQRAVYHPSLLPSNDYYQFAVIYGGRFRTYFSLGRIYRSVTDWADLMLYFGKGNERGKEKG